MMPPTIPAHKKPLAEKTHNIVIPRLFRKMVIQLPLDRMERSKYRRVVTVVRIRFLVTDLSTPMNRILAQSALNLPIAYPSLLGAEIGSMCNQNFSNQVMQRRVYRILERDVYSRIQARFDFRKFYGIEFFGNIRDNDSFQSLRDEMAQKFPEISPKWIWWKIHLDSENTDVEENEFQLVSLEEAQPAKPGD